MNAVEPYYIDLSVDGFSAHSGLTPLLSHIPSARWTVSPVWSRVSRKSWTAGNVLRQWGIRYYGNKWNALLPHWDEARLLRSLPKSKEAYPVHFLWGEFASPKRVAPYHKRGGKVIVSVHCSARRWDSVWLRPDGFAHADEVVLTSDSQRPFVERHVPAECVRTILHGVVSDYFTPAAEREPGNGKLRLLLIGNTERDHEFSAAIAAKLPADRFEWRIRTVSHEKKFYQDVSCVHFLPRLSDEAFLAEYQQADVLCMPMLDSAANNVFLESMACGTPVMTNNVGGVPEYLHASCNFVMSNERRVDEWVEKLLWVEKNRDALQAMRPAVRAWAERFDWRLIAEEYRQMYRDVLARG